MAITSKNRSDLKGYFVKNAIPTEQNFADLVDAQLNQADDGVFKLGDDPLSVVAAPGEQKRVLRLYGTYPAPSPDWTVSLEPRTNANDPSTGRPGFGLDSPDGNNRLFLDATGKLGLGTTTPEAKLTVRDGDVRIHGGRARKLEISSDTDSAGIAIVAREAGNPHIDLTNGDLPDSRFGLRFSAVANDKLALTSGVTSRPMLGIGVTPQEALHVNGNAKLSGSLTSASVSTPNLTVTGNAIVGNLVTSGSEVRHSGRIQANGGIEFARGNLTEHIDTDGALYRYGGSMWLTVDDFFYVRDRTTENDAKAFTFNTNNGKLSLAGDLDAGGKVYSGGVQVLPLRIVSGSETATQSNLSGSGERTKIWNVSYSAFTTAPTIMVSLQLLDAHRDRNLRADCYAQNVTATSAQIVFRTWGDTIIYGAHVAWIAYGT